MKSSRFKNTKSLNFHLLKSASGTIVLRGINVVFNMLITVVLARVLGAKEFGTYSYVMVIVQFLVILASLGLPQIIVREVAINKAKNRWEPIKGIYLWSMASSLGIALLITMAVGVFAWIYKIHLGINLAITLLIGLSILPLHTTLRMQEAFLRGLSFIIQGQLPMQLIRSGLFLAVISMCLFFSKPLSPIKAIGIHAGSFGVAVIFSIFLIMNLVNLRGIKPQFDTKFWMRSMWAFYFIEIADTIYSYADIFFLGTIKGPEDVGIYRIAHRLSFIIVLLTISINVALSPTIAGLYAKGEKRLLESIIVKRTRILFLLTLPFTLLFVIWGSPLISIIFGREFSPAAKPLCVLLIAQMIVVAMGPVRDLLNLTGYEYVTVRGLIFSMILIIPLCFILIPQWGAMGAALASSINMVVVEFILTIQAIKLTGIHPTIFGKS
ncbi:MAG: oligosaccharide flippase family protein [Desulfonauticus sp.]|nr:oligosaccharide flippase family protein [Desulfonauticus sp.]